MRLSALLVAITLSVWQLAAFAADWDVQALMNELGARSSGTARFSETRYVAILDTPIKQSGTLAYAPGRLEKTTLSPRLERMTINGDSLTIESGPNKKTRRLRLSRYPALWGFVEGMRATLTGDLGTLQDFYEIELYGSRDDWELVLVPSQRQMRAVIRLVSIRGDGAHIKIIEMVETTGDRSVTRVTEDAS